MKFKNAKIKILDLDLRGCLYLNNFSHSQRVALFFKIISRAGDGPFGTSCWRLYGNAGHYL